MIKVEKNLEDVPDSLKLPLNENFPNGVPSQPTTTHRRRLELIESESYIDNNNYNSRYKQSDIQAALRLIYKRKCAYCEQKIEQSHIEHYRPKKKYYWLAFSWDNLILACPFCNLYKDIHFDLDGEIVTFLNNDENLSRINVSSASYDTTELPKMINPETVNPLGHIHFERNGVIKSEDNRFSYTIEKCKIDRKYLNDRRRKLLKTFENDINAALVFNSGNTDDQEREIAVLVRKFIRDSFDEESEFLAFRRYAYTNNWLNDIVKEKRVS
ncbi:HNH endonuclease [Zobellia galactanivorans]|uniref:HNH endonuclease n=1 Tax=Zobellia galactanivorans (strain DSM 12802 / CCUG 47099 / CIP 106680 / NCIMB 13871 / Dsij) TaxID=63186 RepID=UPI0026E45B61|nr:HNH endonuclease [Zobellia galactanivorans]MDO6808881.1 HNH endonuclease [Zobellia galactanivorans]